MQDTQFYTRLRIVYGVMIAVALLITYKLVQLQLVEGENYYNTAHDQYTGIPDTSIERGSIYFVKKNGERVSAATMQTGYKLYINPTIIQNPTELYTTLSTHTTINSEKFHQQAMKKDDPYEEVAERVREEQAQAIRALKIPGVGLAKHQWRYYPGASLAAQTIGFIGSSSADDLLVGRYGLEKYYEDILKRDEKKSQINFFAQLFTDLGKTVRNDKDTRAGDVVTTLEPHVQQFLDDALEGVVRTWDAESAGGIIMDPRTGAIRAMSVVPSFDLNNKKNIPEQVFSNPLIQSNFEMGSIIKPLVVAMGIDTGAITADTTYYDAGSVQVGDRVIRNFDKKARGTVTMTEVLKQSLNTGMVYIVERMERSTVKDYFVRLGMREKTGIDMPYEASGLSTNLDANRRVEYANISFGQGVSFTPIQTVRALATLANDGLLIKPHLVERIDFKNGFSKKITLPEPEQIFAPETVEKVTRILVALVDTSFKSRYPQLDLYSIAAKTGTAQMARPGGRGYYEDRNLHSFVGYFPAYDPQYILFFYAIDPKAGARFSSETLSGPFMKTVQFLSTYYDIAPDRIKVE